MQSAHHVVAFDDTELGEISTSMRALALHDEITKLDFVREFFLSPGPPTSLIFCSGPNALAPRGAAPASSMRRTHSARAHDDMGILADGAAWAVYAALHASAACGCDAVLIPFVSGGLYAGPHHRDPLRFLFLENIRRMLFDGFHRAPALGVHFRTVTVVFLP